MLSVEQTTGIDAPPDEVFAVLDDPRNHVEIVPGLVDVSDVEALTNGGKRATYRYKLAGVSLVGTVEDVERSPGSDLVQELSGAIDGTIGYHLADVPGGTELRYEAEYAFPGTPIEAVLAPTAATYNRREAAATLANLATSLER